MSTINLLTATDSVTHAFLKMPSFLSLAANKAALVWTIFKAEIVHGFPLYRASMVACPLATIGYTALAIVTVALAIKGVFMLCKYVKAHPLHLPSCISRAQKPTI